MCLTHLHLPANVLTRRHRLSGLSWLIGSSLHDVLTSIIFLFVRHPFDVGDRIDLGAPNGTFTVKEIHLLSTILLNGNGTYVQVSNNVLAGLVSLRNVIWCRLANSQVFTIVYSKYSPKPQGRLTTQSYDTVSDISC
jgi:hypothetical protein